MRGITRVIVAVLLVVGAVPAVGAAQAIDYTDAKVAHDGAAVEPTHTHHQHRHGVGPDDGDDPGDANATTADDDDDVGGDDTPARVSDDWWDRVRCLRPLPVDPSPPIEPIPCEDDAELVLVTASRDGGFPTQGGVVRVHRFAGVLGDGPNADGIGTGKPTYDDLTLERGYVRQVSNKTADAVVAELEHTDSWASVHAGSGGDGGAQAGRASGSKAELVEAIARFERGDSDTGNVLGGLVVTYDDGTYETVVLVEELDKASPQLYRALASQYGDDRRTVVVELTKEIDKASPKIYEARDPDDDGDGVSAGDAADTQRAGNSTDSGGIDVASPQLYQAVAPDGSSCPIQWPTGPYDPNGPTTVPCPVFAAFTTDTAGVAGAVTPSDAHGVAGAVTPSDAHDVAGAVSPSNSHGITGAVSPSDAHDVAGAISPSDSHAIAGAITPSDVHELAGAVTPSRIADYRAVLLSKHRDTGGFAPS